MTFGEIEQVLGFALPNTARKDSAWWANERTVPSRHVQCKAWQDAGFRTENVDTDNEMLDFVLKLSKK